MKFITRRRTAAAILAGVLCLSLAGCAAGSSGSDAPAESVYSPVVPQNPIAEDVPGENLGAEIGETVSYQEKVTASLNQVIELDDTDKTKSRTLIAEMTITNNSDAAIDCSTLTHFSGRVNGEDALVTQWRGKEQLAHVLSKHVDSLGIGTLFGESCKLVLD